ncbi:MULTISPECIES: hypothetical protein [Streptomyces griseus group]|uniref:hypothetical protein n=1 Tax=Streptomyces griseus group TaxID=629295 RepID=UPI002F914256|nr:hypothetical protein OG215_36750 [Streptomyces globisporus]
MTSPSVRIALTGATTVAAALLLTACTGLTPVEHGIVKDKRGHGGYTPTNCRTMTNAFTQSLTLTGGSSGGRSSTTGSGSHYGSTNSGSSSGNSKPAAPKNLQKASPEHGTVTPKNKQKDTGGPSPRRVCDYVKPRWEIKLQDGDRTGWKQVSKAFWDDVEKGDRV